MSSWSASAGLVAAIPARTPAPPAELWRHVEVVRTAHGVPHIRAENLRAAGYALVSAQANRTEEAAANQRAAATRPAHG